MGTAAGFAGVLRLKFIYVGKQREIRIA